jgi:TPR repeat protein
VRWIITGLMLAACSSKSPPPQAPAPTPTPTPAPAPAACLADEVDELEELFGGLELRDCGSGDARYACEHACAGGDSNACWNLGMAHEAEGSQQASKERFRRACVAGHANGCTNYAAALWNSEPGPADYECARRIFARACETGDHFACGMDGRLRLDRAEGDDVERGRAVLERSCVALRGFPCHILALNLELGRLGPTSPEQLRSLMAEACAGGDESACAPFETVEGSFRPR